MQQYLFNFKILLKCKYLHSHYRRLIEEVRYLLLCAESPWRWTFPNVNWMQMVYVEHSIKYQDWHHFPRGSFLMWEIVPSKVLNTIASLTEKFSNYYYKTIYTFLQKKVKKHPLIQNPPVFIYEMDLDSRWI